MGGQRRGGNAFFLRPSGAFFFSDEGLELLETNEPLTGQPRAGFPVCHELSRDPKSRKAFRLVTEAVHFNSLKKFNSPVLLPANSYEKIVVRLKTGQWPYPDFDVGVR